MGPTRSRPDRLAIHLGKAPTPGSTRRSALRIRSGSLEITAVCPTFLETFLHAPQISHAVVDNYQSHLFLFFLSAFVSLWFSLVFKE